MTAHSILCQIAVVVVSGIFLVTALILALTMFRLMCCEGRRYSGSAARKNVAHRYKTDKTICETNWAMSTSICSTLMCTAYGTYFMYEYDLENSCKLLTGHVEFVPNTIAVTFRTIAILLILSNNLWKLNQKYTENDESPVKYYTILCLRFLICLSSLFTFIGIFLDHAFKNKKYWYYTNFAGYLIATFVIFWIGKLFYQQLKECDLEAITDAEISHISKSDTESHKSLPIPVISSSGESKIDHLSKQVLLSWLQSVFMIFCGLSQASMYVYYYFSHKGNDDDDHDWFQYFALPIQCISLCLTIILINWCIWLSLDFTHGWYEYICCCHSCVRNSIRKEVKRGKTGTTPNINTIISINPATTIANTGYNYSGAQIQHGPINNVDLRINAPSHNHKRQEYQSLVSAPENQGDFNNNVNEDLDNGSSISCSGVSINNFSNIG